LFFLDDLANLEQAATAVTASLGCCDNLTGGTGAPALHQGADLFVGDTLTNADKHTSTSTPLIGIIDNKIENRYQVRGVSFRL
jgi:hypothetical protein